MRRISIYFHDKCMQISWNTENLEDDTVTTIFEGVLVKFVAYFKGSGAEFVDGFGIKMTAVNIVLNGVSPVFVRVTDATDNTEPVCEPTMEPGVVTQTDDLYISS
jgi:hypothetical protein